jgi:hypothetical protein
MYSRELIVTCLSPCAAIFTKSIISAPYFYTSKLAGHKGLIQSDDRSCHPATPAAAAVPLIPDATSHTTTAITATPMPAKMLPLRFVAFKMPLYVQEGSWIIRNNGGLIRNGSSLLATTWARKRMFQSALSSGY